MRGVLPERSRYELIPGNWSTYEQRIAEAEAARRAEAEAARTAARRSARSGGKKKAAADTGEQECPYARWSLEELEEAITDRENKLAEAEAQFANPEVYRNPERARGLRAETDTLRSELDALNTAWEAEAERME